MHEGRLFISEGESFTTNEISARLRKSFVLPVDKVFEIPGKGSVLTGRITSGVVRVGESVLLRSGSREIALTVAFIESNRNLINEAYFTEQVGLMFKDMDLSFVGKGDVLIGIPT